MDKIKDRDRAAVVNKYLKTIDMEFKTRRTFSDREEEILMLKPLLYRILILSYTPIDWVGLKSQEFDMKWYQSGDLQKDFPQDRVLRLLCGDDVERVKIEEVYPVKNLYLVRYLPMAVGYMLQKGISNMDTEGKLYPCTLQFMAYWVFELDTYLPAEERNVIEMELLERAYVELKDNGISDFKTERKLIIAAVINEYVEMLKKYFKQFLYGKNKEIFKESNNLINRIDKAMD